MQFIIYYRTRLWSIPYKTKLWSIPYRTKALVHSLKKKGPCPTEKSSFNMYFDFVYLNPTCVVANKNITYLHSRWSMPPTN